MAEDKAGSIMVVGGGISGLTAAIEAAEVGHPVVLIEKEAYLGGRVAQNSRYFPKLCPPYCGLEINFRRIKNNPNLHFLTLARVEKVEGERGNFRAAVQVQPRYVNEKCTACGKCADVCPVERPNAFNYGLDKTKAVYLPHDLAFPFRYVIDPETCLGKQCAKCVEVCPYDAIELDMDGEHLDLNVGAIIWATGWQPFDASKIDYYGFGKNPNVISNVMMERLASVNGPTQGRILRPSDGGEVRSVAFVQCAGSRDVNHLPYCSGVCCLASMKQALYVREQYPEAEVSIFYIDIRAMGRYEDFFNRIQADEKISLVKGKVADIREDSAAGQLVLQVEDVSDRRGIQARADLVVLATGMVPATADGPVPVELERDEYGFALDSETQSGILPVGCVKKPVDVSHSVKDATGGALRAIQSLVRR